MELEALEQEVGGRNDGGAKRRQIMEGARQVFLSGGFDGASMNDVARAAGVSKGTLYAYFNSKDELFEAIIRARIRASRRAALHLQARGRRTRDADRLRRPAHQPDVRAGNACAGAGRHRGGREVPQHRPRVLRSWSALRRDAPRRRTENLERSGELKVPDPERAAWQFLDLCQSYVYKRLLFGVVETRSVAKTSKPRSRRGSTFF